jgi:ubiquinone/menaquinone biosynthesis C-methylase UbiE
LKREFTNIIRFILEDCTPPIIRDIPLINTFLSFLSGINLKKCRQLRIDIPNLTPEKIDSFYRDFPRIQEDTDNSKKCVEQIISSIHGQSLCDVGCGTGYVLNRISLHHPIDRLVGVDFTEHKEWKSFHHIQFLKGDILNLPFENGRFDTVVCTHILEHILDIKAAIQELRRVYSRRLIIVVPRERESLWSLNPHFHYFPYEHSFLKHLLPLPAEWSIKRIGRDYFYVEDKKQTPTDTRHSS